LLAQADMRLRHSMIVAILLLAACDAADSDEPGQAARDAAPPGAPDAGVDQPVGRTFEGEPVGEPPTGTRVYGTVTVEDVTVAGVTTRAVRVVDSSTTSQSRVMFLNGDIPARRFGFDLLPRSASAATLIAVHGTGASEDTGTWRFLIAPAAAPKDPKQSGKVTITAQ